MSNADPMTTQAEREERERIVELEVRVVLLERALSPFARHIGKDGAPITLTIGDDTWTGTLTTDDFYLAYDAYHMKYEKYRTWKAECGEHRKDGHD